MGMMPEFWDFMLQSLFRVQNPRLRQQLWAHFPKSQVLTWHLEKCAEPAPSQMAQYERIKQMAAHLDLATLARVAEQLAPEGKPRPRELRDFEEAVLNLMDAHGKLTDYSDL